MLLATTTIQTGYITIHISSHPPYLEQLSVLMAPCRRRPQEPYLHTSVYDVWQTHENIPTPHSHANLHTDICLCRKISHANLITASQ